jgi:hypothetical protein
MSTEALTSSGPVYSPDYDREVPGLCFCDLKDECEFQEEE